MPPILKKALPAKKAEFELKIEKLPISKVQYHPENPRTHDEKNIQAIMRSLSEFEQNQPIVLWGKENFVIVGNGRLESMKRLGKTHVFVTHADHLTEDQAKAYMIADNKTGDLSSFDDELLARLMQDISNNDQLLDATGYDRMELEPLLTADLPSAPEGMEDLVAPEGVANLDETGSSEALGRLILVFKTSEERAALCAHLGIDAARASKQTFTMQDMASVRVTPIKKALPLRK